MAHLDARSESFQWPHGKRMALSLTFDDARPSQIDRGIPILDAYGVRATFYVSPGALAARLPAWQKAVAIGHEIGNHTLTHPCSANFVFARRKALEDYTLEQMEQELLQANAVIHEQLGVTPQTFAYPCGQSFVGRGVNVQSYVPLVARHFLVGRSAFDEIHNAPVYMDLAQAMAMDADDADFATLRRLIEGAREEGGWLILLGHDVGEGGRQTVRADALEQLCAYAQDPANGIWIDTVLAIGRYVRDFQAS